MIFKTLHVDDFRSMCAERESEKKEILSNGGSACKKCNGTGTHHGRRSMTIFGCKDCGGIGAITLSKPNNSTGEDNV